MVRGRRVRAFISVKGSDNCDSPKRKDQRLDFSDKLTQVVSPNNLVKTQTITDFFQVVQDEDKKVKNYVTETLLDACHIVANGNYIEKEEIREKITEICNDTDLKKKDEPKAATPHRIELCSENQRSPSSQLSQLHLANTKKTVSSKVRRKLNTNGPTTKKEILKEEINNKNHQLTEYFPVRRSVRKTKKIVLEEKQKNIEDLLRSESEEGLKIKYFDDKGRGVVATQQFLRGDFVVEYYGELIDMTEAKKREQKYAQDQNTGCYMYYFKHKNQQYCVDATAETGRLGRLVNHSRNGNLITRIISVDSLPRLVLIAKDDIQIDEEVTYDYGDRSKESLKYHPWLAS